MSIQWSMKQENTVSTPTSKGIGIQRDLFVNHAKILKYPQLAEVLHVFLGE